MTSHNCSPCERTEPECGACAGGSEKVQHVNPGPASLNPIVIDDSYRERKKDTMTPPQQHCIKEDVCQRYLSAHSGYNEDEPDTSEPCIFSCMKRASRPATPRPPCEECIYQAQAAKAREEMTDDRTCKTCYHPVCMQRTTTSNAYKNCVSRTTLDSELLWVRGRLEQVCTENKCVRDELSGALGKVSYIIRMREESLRQEREQR